MRRRFWIEALLSFATLAAALLTVVWRDWIERLFRLDPDGGSGSVEWLIVVALVLVSVSMAALAVAESRRAAAT